MSRVDVVVPCYNYARFLDRCVNSVLSQRDVTVRVLILDDTSTDDTPLAGARLACADSRVEFRRHRVNMGHIATYNEGLLGWASADYSLLLSADDALVPGALARAVHLMDRHSDVGMTYGMALIVGDERDLDSGALASESDEYRIVPSADFVQHCCEFGNPVPTPTAVVRTSLQHQVGGYRADLPHTGDMEMWMRFAVHAPIAVLRAVQGCYRWHAGNMSTTYYTALLSDQRERFRACSEIIDRWGSRFDQSPQWRAAASRRVGEEAFWLASRAFDRGDVSESLACASFAQEIWPELRHSGIWRRFQLKRLAGHVVWRGVRLARSQARRLGGARPDTLDTSHGFRLGQVNGWWPGAA